MLAYHVTTAYGFLSSQNIARPDALALSMQRPVSSTACFLLPRDGENSTLSEVKATLDVHPLDDPETPVHGVS